MSENREIPESGRAVDPSEDSLAVDPSEGDSASVDPSEGGGNLVDPSEGGRADASAGGSPQKSGGINPVQHSE